MSRLFFPLLVLSLIACCIEVDISVPGFPDMAHYFGVSEGKIQLTIALNFVGFCLASLIYGPLSEAYGRRVLMVAGNFVMVIGAVGCVIAPNLELLLAARFVQGLGAAASAVVVFAMIADTYQGQKSARLIGVMNSLLTTAMAAAPVIGGFINEAIGWRGNYCVVAVVSAVSWVLLLVLLPETRQERSVVSWRKISGDFRQLLSSGRFMVYAIVPSTCGAAYFSFIACASFLYQETYQIDIVTYSLHQGLIVGAFSVVSSFAANIAAYIGRHKSLTLGGLMGIGGALLMLSLSFFGKSGAYSTTLSMILFSSGAAIVYPLVFASSLEIFPDMRGTASSLIMSFRAFIISVSVALMGYFYDGSARNVALIILVIMILAFCLVKLILKFERQDHDEISLESYSQQSV